MQYFHFLQLPAAPAPQRYQGVEHSFTPCLNNMEVTTKRKKKKHKLNQKLSQKTTSYV